MRKRKRVCRRNKAETANYVIFLRIHNRIIFRARKAKNSRENLRAINAYTYADFVASPSRFAEHKVQERRIPRISVVGWIGWQERERWKGKKGVGNSRPENRNFCSFQPNAPLLLPRRPKRFRQWRFSIDSIGEIYRSRERPLVRRIVLPCHNAKSRFFLFPRPTTTYTTRKKTACLWRRNTPEMIQFPHSDYQQTVCAWRRFRVSCLDLKRNECCGKDNIVFRVSNVRIYDFSVCRFLCIDK